MPKPSPHAVRATPSTRFRLRLALPLILPLALAACGGGGGDSGPSVIDNPPAASAGGLVFIEANKLNHLDLSSGQLTQQDYPDQITFQQFGYGGGAFVATVDLTFSNAFDSHWSAWQNNGFTTLPGWAGRTIEPHVGAGYSGYIGSRIQPSPDGKHFAFTTRESAGLNAPFNPYLYVATTDTLAAETAAGYTDASWVDNTTLVASAADGLFLVRIDASGLLTASRIGPVGLARPGTNAEVRYPSVSPNGTQVAFVQDGAVWRIGLDGSGLTQLTTAAEAAWPAWSPDGQQLVVIDHACIGSSYVVTSKPHYISATQTNQVLSNAPMPQMSNGGTMPTCGPIYWVR